MSKIINKINALSNEQLIDLYNRMNDLYVQYSHADDEHIYTVNQLIEISETFPNEVLNGIFLSKHFCNTDLYCFFDRFAPTVTTFNAEQAREWVNTEILAEQIEDNGDEIPAEELEAVKKEFNL